MAITNPLAVNFSNEELRIAADKLAQTFYFLKVTKDRWNALSMSTLIPNDASEVMEDGAVEDGRPIVDGAMLNTLIQRIDTFLNDLEANSDTRLKQILKVAVNTGV